MGSKTCNDRHKTYSCVCLACSGPYGTYRYFDTCKTHKVTLQNFSVEVWLEDINSNIGRLIDSRRNFFLLLHWLKENNGNESRSSS